MLVKKLLWVDGIASWLMFGKLLTTPGIYVWCVHIKFQHAARRNVCATHTTLLERRVVKKKIIMPRRPVFLSVRFNICFVLKHLNATRTMCFTYLRFCKYDPFELYTRTELYYIQLSIAHMASANITENKIWSRWLPTPEDRAHDAFLAVVLWRCLMRCAPRCTVNACWSRSNVRRLCGYEVWLVFTSFIWCVRSLTLFYVLSTNIWQDFMGTLVRVCLCVPGRVYKAKKEVTE